MRQKDALMLLKSFNGNTSCKYANRGMNLENDINLSNKYYKDNDIAYIYKKPTPIKIVKVDYEKGLIKEAYFAEPSTTDYNGIYKEKYIDFEAKETNSKTSFSLANIHKHQIEHLLNVERHGAISFLIVRFNETGDTFILEAKYLKDFLQSSKRKSIPLKYFKEFGVKIKIKYSPRLDYLSEINKIYFGGDLNDEKKKC